VVSGGRGTGGNFEPVEAFADVLGAAVGTSRAAVGSVITGVAANSSAVRASGSGATTVRSARLPTLIDPVTALARRQGGVGRVALQRRQWGQGLLPAVPASWDARPVGAE
jgi:hypothetical protein